MRPASMSIRSTAPSSPANVVQVGVPSSAASRFMVPPALTTRSAAYTSDGPSTGFGGHDDARDALEPLRLLGGPRQQHDLGVAARAGGRAPRRTGCSRCPGDTGSWWPAAGAPRSGRVGVEARASR